ncbi:MAG TPA: type II toxin-antitoxin system RelE/ParE family toxin [Thermoanaerobaculia bacterium]|nr:type II toxin-antitoxin system RelE/ParE family toxin [Thermoanaerobaculia bacterium]
MRTYELDRLAKRELREAIRFYEDRASGLGRSVAAEFQVAVAFLLERPLAAATLRGQLRAKPLRRFPYTLIYTLDGDVVRIWAFMHQSRRPGYWSDRIGS